MRRVSLAFLLLFGYSVAARATVFGSVRGIVHDPQHRPVPGAQVTLKSQSSDFHLAAQTDANGEFHFDAVPLGQYAVNVSAADSAFSPEEQIVTVLSGTAPVLHFELRLAAQNQSITVSADAASGQLESVTPTSLVDRKRHRRKRPAPLAATAWP